MTSFLDALKDFKDTQRALEAAKSGGIFAALEVHQQMAERHQLRDLAAAAQESLDLQRKQAEKQADRVTPPTFMPPPAQLTVPHSRSSPLDSILEHDARAEVVIFKLESFISQLRAALAEAGKFNSTTVKQNAAVLDDWLRNFKQKKQAELREREALRKKWLKSAEDKDRLDNLETVWCMAGPWGGEDTFKKIRGVRWACDYFGFGPKEIAAYEVKSVVSMNYYDLNRRIDGSFSNTRMHAEHLGVAEKLDALAKTAKDLVESEEVPAKARPKVSQAITPPPNDATPTKQASSLKESEQYVVDACLKAMCLVAAANGRLSAKEIQYITSEMKKHGFAVDVPGLQDTIIETCRQLVRTSYVNSAKKLVKQLVPFRGRPLASLVLELMEGVALADGNTGNREAEILGFFRKHLSAAK
jgi:hypothetical protein